MSQLKAHRVELHQGNPTVRGLMRRALEEAGFEPVTEAGDEELAELLVVDVDSGLEVDQERQAAYRQAEHPVLLCGVRASREKYPDAEWLERPFVPSGFVAQCRDLIGADAASEPEGSDSDERDDSDDPDEASETHKLSSEETERLEEQLGLQKGTLSQADDDETDESLDDTDNLNPDEEPEFIDLDDSNSIELGVEDLEDVAEGSGGSIFGEISRDTLGEDELEWEEPQAQPPEAVRSPSLNQTMPDAPAAMAPKGLFDSPSQPTPTPEVRERSGVSSRGSGPRLPPELEHQIEGAARLLAESWSRIGLAARRRDRAEHIQRVLRAVLSGGVSAAASQIERIPGADGFSGSLGVISLVEVLGVVRALGLRGRLEVSAGADDFVLYLEGERLADVENLSGSDDRRLLEILLEMGAIATEVFDELEDSLDSELAAPLQMQLRQDDLVPPADIKRARRLRARRLFDQLRGADRGSFAFMEVEEGTGHAWPVDGLEIELATLLGEAARETSGQMAAPEAQGGSTGEETPPELKLDDDMPATVEVPEADDF